jgi:hypothetical protein
MKGVIYMDMNNLYKLRKTIPEYIPSTIKPSNIIETVEYMRIVREEIASSYKNKSSKIES